eukprot:TRINITY_DN5162_c0_g1_i5.p1 TRINITY_DN5162_c0_g1~~TRINITY_DN5162_c0_g1_i5.p1  ORF type:complete len:496 (-),score=76.48 TRINITY_DN5162_c0_g1_i5:59-1546(-)
MLFGCNFEFDIAMPSWASVAGEKVPQVQEPGSGPSWLQNVQNVCVVDANAIISGIRFQRVGDAVVTIPEVISEVRDQKSREYLEQLPFGIQVLQPETQHLNRIRTFARDTGDLQVLSEVDMKLLALSLQLEIALYGSDEHLRRQPLPAKQRSSSKKSGKKRSGQLIGWDYVPNPDEWAEMDEETNQQTGQSRIGQGVFDVNCNDSSTGTNEFSFKFDGSIQQGSITDEEVFIEVDFEYTGLKQSPIHLQIFEVEYQDAEEGSEDDELWDIQEQEEFEEAGYSDNDDTIFQSQQDEQNESQNDEEGWQVASKSKNSRRRHQRRQRRWENRQKTGNQSQRNCLYDASETQTDTADSVSALSIDGRRVSCITADYAMQNVLLQMGLKLVTPDGRRISEIKKWALRCQTCFLVVKESGRIFCPRCGKASLSKVEVTINGEGVECFGVRKKHCLKGTRFTLPKPKAGRYAKNPITTEDELMLKVKRLQNCSKLKNGNLRC